MLSFVLFISTVAFAARGWILEKELKRAVATLERRETRIAELNHELRASSRRFTR